MNYPIVSVIGKKNNEYIASVNAGKYNMGETLGILNISKVAYRKNGEFEKSIV